ncbi:hypothetical protein [Actinomadura bangladeshensis]|uniref:Uncharacterized protein n=1 Tax=Actinomadura bangladeshensis TaxID=453573 RepID=A0A4R4NL35_9ACTN|nr:hypothetical protein [Actinomadura bangladeshensis]TDC09879.1 hypothetical protein E1284_28830 [Actinomadura bangladeshensis]
MKLDAVAKASSEAGFGRRFFLIGYFPVYAAALWLLLLVWAGAWGPLRFADAWKTASGLGLGEVLLLILALTVVAVVLQPFQLAMMRMLEGAGPAWPGRGRLLRGQQARKNELMARAVVSGPGLTPAQLQEAGESGHELRRRFPRPAHLLRATALGNVLTAMEDGAGRAYGIDPVVAWPRLYPLLGERVRELVDDRRDSLDLAGRMAVTMALTAVATGALLSGSGPWWSLTLIPVVLAWTSYRGAVHAALAYAESVTVAFDLHRAELFGALRVDLPTTHEAERELNEAWCDHWRQGVPLRDALPFAGNPNESYLVHKEQK